MKDRKLLYLLFLVLFASIALGDLLRVPTPEYPTIQSALDAISSADTVLVVPAIYAEALYAPNFPFVLKGDVIPDSGDYPRPVIDPETLPGSDTMACLKLPREARVTIEDFIFKNGHGMHPHSETSVGGIHCASSGVVLRNCLFDSTYRSLYHNYYSGQIRVDTISNCVFRNIFLHSINALEHSVMTENCLFESCNSLQFCVVGDGSTFRNCRFGVGATFSSLVLNGDEMEVSNCIFGPIQGGSQQLLTMSQGLGNVYIHDNIFIGNETIAAALKARSSTVNGFLIERNIFMDHTTTGVGGAVYIGGDEFIPNRGGTIRDNLFQNCFNTGSGANALFADADIVVLNNRFVETALDLHNRPTVYFRNGSRSALAENLFYWTDIAVNSIADTLDAQWNWWGHESGPFHNLYNPTGLGDTITGGVLFEPWYADSSLINSAEDPFIPQPSFFNLSVYPNPFNSFAKIRLEVPEPMVVKVELFDLLGRRVKEIYNAPVAREKEISFTAENLSSGVYFVRAKDTIRNRPLATKKLLLMK